MKRREFMAILGGAAVSWSIAARAQQVAHRVAIVHPSHPVATLSETGGNPYFRALFEELRRLGYVEGQKLVIERYSGEGRTERYAELTRNVVSLKPDLIFTVSARMVQHLRAETTTIPIVAVASDPVAFGLAKSLARPGGNLTGVIPDAGLEIWDKRLELLRQVVPTASKVGFLGPRALMEGTSIPAHVRALRDMAARAGISLVTAALDSPIGEVEFRRVFAELVREKVDALIVGDSAENFTHRAVIVDLAQKNRLPTTYPYRDFVPLGGLMSYAGDLTELYLHAAGQIDRIFRGEHAGEIPFYQVSRWDLFINLKTAAELGLTVPPSILVRAKEIIE
jgi:putative ABC transport system substrate-binding protein